MNEAQLQHETVRELIERARREHGTTLDLSFYKSILAVRLEQIPEEVFELLQLETLILSDNNIREVPERIRKLMNLKRLDLTKNLIEKVPDIPGLALD